VTKPLSWKLVGELLDEQERELREEAELELRLVEAEWRRRIEIARLEAARYAADHHEMLMLATAISMAPGLAALERSMDVS
jgi:hypothetical protein